MISSDNKTYRLLRCPYCKCYDANHFYEVKTPLPVRFSHADTTEAAAPIHPIVCGRCGGIFVKFTDLELLNSY